MTTRRVGILHPGEMGISIAASAQRSGAQVWWASEGRRPQTRIRAEKYGLVDGDSVAAACFSAGPLETQVLGTEIGSASALKICYAAYAKGATALMCAVLGAAESLGVRDALHSHWARSDGTAEASDRIGRALPKAWRYVGEMDEIAATFRSAGLPGEFHDAAAEIYRGLSGFKDAAGTPTPDEMVGELLAALPKHRAAARG